MSYWKGLAVAAALDLAWIAACPAMPTDPAPPRVIEAVAELVDIDRHVDSLMMHLQAHDEDVDAMQALADLCLSHSWHEAAIGPLARALQLDPSQRSLWVALDRAVERSGRQKITDAELTRRAQQFVEAIEMWGHGC